MRIDSRSTLRLQSPRSKTLILPGPDGVAGHYNGPAMGMAGKDHEQCQERWRGIQSFHMAAPRNWADIAYTAASCFHGVILEGRGPGIRTAANGTEYGNDNYYAIFFMIGGEEKPNDEMLRAADWYAREHLDVSFWRPHSSFKSTACPGKVHSYIKDGRLVVPGPSIEEDDVYVIKHGDGLGTPNGDPRVKRVQKVMAVAAEKMEAPNPFPKFGQDGQYGNEMRDAVNFFSRKANLPEKGDVGVDVLVLDYCRGWLR